MATPHGEESYEEVSDGAFDHRPQWWTKSAMAVGAACALLLVGFATGAHFWSPKALTSNVLASSQLNEIVVVPPPEKCAKTGVNCLNEKCCKISGYTCYEKHSGYAQCMKECVPGRDGTCLTQATMKQSRRSTVSLSANTLFCFSVYTKDTGSWKKSYELDLIRTQLFLGVSIFGCEAYKVYSDVQTWLSPGKIDTVKLNDDNGNFHFAKRKKVGTWINSNIFIAAWKAIKESYFLWLSKDWTVKVDVDAVFLPMRLRAKLANIEVTDNGIYLENCKWVRYGFFGNLEVLSQKAVSTYLQNLDDCKTVLNYMGSEKKTGNEPWGEDLFAQRCMDLHGVDKVSAFDISTDATCAAWRPEGQKKNQKWRPDCGTTQTPAIHPFKKPAEYFACLKATQR